MVARVTNNFPQPHGPIRPVSTELRNQFNEHSGKTVPIPKASKGESVVKLLKQSGGGMFGDRELKEGPMQIAGSRNYQDLELASKTRIGISPEEKKEMAGLELAMDLLYRPAKSTVMARYYGFGVSEEEDIFPPMIRKAYERDLILWEAEEEKVQEFLDHPPEELLSYLKSRGQTVDIFREPIYDPHLIFKNRLVPPALFDATGKLGFLSQRAPKENGGGGLNQRQYGAFLRKSVRKKSGTLEGIESANSAIGIEPLLMYGSPKQKAKYLSEMAKGTYTCAFGLTEPGSGTDAGDKMTTTAELSADGTKYIVNGAKIFTTNFHTAGVLYLIAKVKDGKGNYVPTAFIVDLPFNVSDTPEQMRGKIQELKNQGLHISLPQPLITIPGSNQSYYELHGFEIPVEQLLGNEGDGLKIAFNALNYGRAGFAEANHEAAVCATEATVEYAVQREIFDMYGGTQADMPKTKREISEMAVRTAGMGAAAEYASALIDEHGDDMNLIAECAAIKAYTSEESNRVMDLAHDNHGGLGFMQGHDIARALLDQKITKPVEGYDKAMVQFHFGAATKPANKAVRDIVKAKVPLIEGLWDLAKPALSTWQVFADWKEIFTGKRLFADTKFGLIETLALQIRTKLLGAKSGILAMGGRDAMTKQHTVLKYGYQDIDHFVLTAAIRKLNDPDRQLPLKERAALEQFVKNKRFGFMSREHYPDEIADLYIADARKHVADRIKEEENLIKDYIARHAAV